MSKQFFLSLFALIGTILGAGIFGVPYVVFHSGIIPALFYFLLLGALVTFLHLIFGEIILRNKAEHRFIYYAKKYLGRPGKYAIVLSTFIGVSGTLLSYVILGGDFLSLVLFQKIDPLFLSIIFWLVLSIAVLHGFQFVARLEAILDILFMIVIAGIFILSLPEADFRSIPLFSYESSTVLAYGVILFTLIGWMGIPEAKRLLEEKQELKHFKKVIIFSGIITTLITVLFGFIFAAVSGPEVSYDTLQGLSPVLDDKVIALTAVLGTLLVATSFLIISYYFIDSLNLDLGIRRKTAKYFVLLLPLILFLMGLRNFIEIIGALGIILGTIEGIVIILCYQKAKSYFDREPEYSLNLPSFFLGIVILVLVIGALSFFLS